MMTLSKLKASDLQSLWACQRIGKFWMVYGNSAEEVIADYSALESLESMFSRWFDEATEGEGS